MRQSAGVEQLRSRPPTIILALQRPSLLLLQERNLVQAGSGDDSSNLFEIQSAASGNLFNCR